MPAILRYTFPDRHILPFIHFKIWFVRKQLNKMREAFDPQNDIAVSSLGENL
jgi:hypothetical protein